MASWWLMRLGDDDLGVGYSFSSSSGWWARVMGKGGSILSRLVNFFFVLVYVMLAKAVLCW